jgi:hypothetical protein
MPLAGFEHTIPVFKRAKTFHALDRAATVTGLTYTHTQPQIDWLEAKRPNSISGRGSDYSLRHHIQTRWEAIQPPV